jgi:hypothetical protein
MPVRHDLLQSPLTLELPLQTLIVFLGRLQQLSIAAAQRQCWAMSLVTSRGSNLQKPSGLI